MVIAEMFLEIVEVMKNNYAKITKVDLKDKLRIKIERLLNAFRERSKCIKEYEVDFLHSEVKRFQRYLHLYSIQCSDQFILAQQYRKNNYDFVIAELQKCPYSSERDKQVEVNLEMLLKIDFITAEEKQSIRQAMASDLGYGTQQGHWYFCACGYVYSVANCGMFNQSGRCPKCHAVIGSGSTNRYANPTYWATSTTEVQPS